MSTDTHDTVRADDERYGPRDWSIDLPPGIGEDHDRIDTLLRADVDAHGWEMVNPDDDPEIVELPANGTSGAARRRATVRVRRPRGHLLHITPTSDWHPDEPDWNFEVTCLNPHRCDGWQECDETHAQDGVSAADGPWDGDEDVPWFEEEEWEFHGVLHVWHDGHGWTVPYPGCVLSAHDSVTDAGWGIAEEHGPGVYAVEDDWDDQSVTLHHLRPATPEEIAR